VRKTTYTPTAMNNQYIVEVKQVDECFIEIPPELLEKMGWKEGDDIKFFVQKDGSIHLKKVKSESIDLDFDDEELFKYMKLAHERGQSFNEFVEEALTEMINKAGFENE